MQLHVKTVFAHGVRLGAIGALVTCLGAADARATEIVDLTTEGSNATVQADLGGTFYVNQINPSSTGTGVIDSFLRINSNDPTESGYNTDADQVLDNVGGGFTHELLLADVPIVTYNGDTYREFFLDINQTNNEKADGNLLSLNQLQFFVASSDPGDAYTQDTSGPTALTALTGATEVFRMSDLSAPIYDLQLNYALNNGSGSGDYRFLIKSSLFGTATNVILYSQFGSPSGAYAETDGFEEWFVGTSNITGGPGDLEVVPEPATLLLLGTGMGLIARRVRRRNHV